MPEITLEDYVAPAAAPHEYLPVIEQLIKAGVNKVATAVFDTEDEAVNYVRQMQVAARQAGVSALKRSLVKVAAKDAEGKPNANAGKFSASVSVRAKITRDRSKGANAATAEVTESE